MNVRFGISDYDLTIYDPPCVKIIQGHPMSYAVTDLVCPIMIDFSPVIGFGIFWSV